LREVNTICRRSWFIAAHIWKSYDFKIEVIPFIINVSTELTTVVKFEVYVKHKKIHEARAFNFTHRYIDDDLSINNPRFAEFLPLVYPPELEIKETTDTASSTSIWDIYLEFDEREEGHNSYPLVCRRPAETVPLQRRQICYR
jgi:hypothetical protein